MDETEFNQLIEATFECIEDTIDTLDFDIDIDTGQGIQTLTLPNTTQVVLTRQAALSQLWLAAKLNGYHFNREENTWVCDKTGKTLSLLLSEILSTALNTTINLKVDE